MAMRTRSYKYGGPSRPVPNIAAMHRQSARLAKGLEYWEKYKQARDLFECLKDSTLAMLHSSLVGEIENIDDPEIVALKHALGL